MGVFCRTGEGPKTKRRIVLQAAGALLAAPRLSFAQASSKTVRIGMLIASNPEATTHLRSAFRARLAELGWREGTNIEYLERYAQSDGRNYERLSREMVARKPDVIFVGYGPFATVVKKHTAEIPIVFSISQDPVGEDLVGSLARPGANVTGTSTRNNELVGKRLQLLKEALPSVTRVGVVRRVGIPQAAEVASQYEELRRVAARHQIEVVEVDHEAARKGDFAAAFAQLRAKRAQAVATIVNWNYGYYREFVHHANQARLPTIGDATEFTDAGGLLSLSIDRAERYRKSAEYVNRILRGAKPGDLPVDEPSVFEMVVNQRAARSLGVTIPSVVILRANRVIE